MNGRVFVFGSINTDLVVYLAALPSPGETVTDGRFESYPGGKGANQAVAASRAGAHVEMFGCLGDDAYGRERLDSLERTGVSVKGVRVLPGVASGIAQINVDAAGENTIAVAPGANARFSAAGIAVPSAPRGETWVSLFQNEVPQDATEALILAAREAGHVVLWNLAPTIRRPPSAQALAAVDFLICNRNELLAFTGGSAADDEEALARRAMGRGIRNLIVTLGRKGSLWIGAEGRIRQPAFPVEAVDTVGAGDCFCGVFAARLTEGDDVPAALRHAAAASAISVTRKGAEGAMPDRAEIEAFLERVRG